MSSVIQNNFRVRKNYATIDQVVEIPNLIDIQRRSYEKFLQSHGDDRDETVGLEGVFRSVFPITDFNETSAL